MIFAAEDKDISIVRPQFCCIVHVYRTGQVGPENLERRAWVPFSVISIVSTKIPELVEIRGLFAIRYHER